MKTNIAVIFGTRSTEHDVSIVTAISSVIKPLELTRNYNVIPVYIAKDGRWFSDPKLKDIHLYTSGKIDSFLAKQKPVSLLFDKGLTLVKPGLRGEKIKVDVAFPATHGTHGEDGELMAILEMAGIPYVGCDVPSSVLAMDKVLARIVAVHEGIEQNRYEWFFAREFTTDQAAVLKKVARLKFPLFVKPAHLGSSIGISRVTNKTELINAIEVAAHYDTKVLVEEAVPNLIEVTVPVMGNDEPRPAMVEQPLVSAEDFFDFDTKYMQGGKKGKGKGKGGDATKGAQGYSKIPAAISEDLYSLSVDTALAVYRALGCSGIARVDLLIDSKAKKVYFNEVNPMPGGLYAHNWNCAGVSSVQLVEKLVELAKERHHKLKNKATTFDTSFLKQF